MIKSLVIMFTVVVGFSMLNCNQKPEKSTIKIVPMSFSNFHGLVDLEVDSAFNFTDGQCVTLLVKLPKKETVEVEVEVHLEPLQVGMTLIGFFPLDYMPERKKPYGPHHVLLFAQLCKYKIKL